MDNERLKCNFGETLPVSVLLTAIVWSTAKGTIRQVLGAPKLLNKLPPTYPTISSQSQFGLKGNYCQFRDTTIVDIQRVWVTIKGTLGIVGGVNQNKPLSNCDEYSYARIHSECMLEVVNLQEMPKASPFKTNRFYVFAVNNFLVKA